MSRQQIIKLTLGLLTLTAVLAGLHSLEITPQKIQAMLRTSGAWGPIAFVLTFAILQSLAVSAHIFIVSASLVWPAEFAVLLSWLGTLGSGLISFFFARYVARDWVQQRIPPKIQSYDSRLEKSGFITVLLLRFILFTSPVLQLGLGISSVKFRDFLLGTAIGNLPTVLVVTFASGAIVAWFQENPEHIYFVALAVLSLAAIGGFVVRVLTKTRSPH